DYILLNRKIKQYSEELENKKVRLEQLDKYIAFSSDIYVLEKLRRRGTTINGEEVAEQINSITKRVMQAERDLTEDATLTFKDVQLLQEVLHSLKLRLQIGR